MLKTKRVAPARRFPSENEPWVLEWSFEGVSHQRLTIQVVGTYTHSHYLVFRIPWSALGDTPTRDIITEST